MFLCKTVTMQAVRALQQSFDREHAYRTERALEQLRTLARARTAQWRHLAALASRLDDETVSPCLVWPRPIHMIPLALGRSRE